MAHALENLDEPRRVARLLPEERPLLPALLALLASVPCRGKNIHDALVVATMRAHRVRTLITSNGAHFTRFIHLIEVEDLAGVKLH